MSRHRGDCKTGCKCNYQHAPNNYCNKCGHYLIRRKPIAIDAGWGEPGLMMSCFFSVTSKDIQRLARYVEEHGEPDYMELIFPDEEGDT